MVLVLAAIGLLLPGRVGAEPGPRVNTAGAAAAITSVAVSFAVQNTNRSKVTCSADGLPYAISAHLVGPSSVLTGATAPVAVVYLHDLGIGEWFWHFSAEPGYDYATQMAQAGFVSVTINELGYLPSGQPPGNSSCVGGQADILHQVIEDLRSGRYTAAGGVSPAFSSVVVAGESIGGDIVEIEAYSFNDTAGLAVGGYSNQGSSQSAQQHFIQAGGVCLTGGEDAQTGGPGGYAYFSTSDDDFKSTFFNAANANPAVIAAATKLRARAPCGDFNSVVSSVVVNGANLASVTTPVLLVYGEKDSSYPPSGGQSEQGNFTGTTDLTNATVANSGHAFTLEHTAPQFRAVIADWLRGHGWGSSPQAPTAPRPAQPPRFPSPLLLVSRRAARLASDGAIPVGVYCQGPRGYFCRGRLTLDIRVRSQHPPVTLGTLLFMIAGQHRARIEIALTARKRKLVFEARRRSPIRVIARVRGPHDEIIRLIRPLRLRP